MKEINNFIEEIVRTVYDSVPEQNWVKGQVDIALLSTYAETTAEYFLKEVGEGIFLPVYPDSPSKKKVWVVPHCTL